MTRRPRVTLERTPSRIKLERLRELLRQHALSKHDIAERLALSIHSAERYIRFLHQPKDGREKQIYVKRWQRGPSGGKPLPFFLLGNEKDAPRPRAFNKAEQSRRAYAKMKREDPARYTAYLDRARLRSKARSRAERGLPLASPDPLLACFFKEEA